MQFSSLLAAGLPRPLPCPSHRTGTGAPCWLLPAELRSSLHRRVRDNHGGGRGAPGTRFGVVGAVGAQPGLPASPRAAGWVQWASRSHGVSGWGRPREPRACRATLFPKAAPFSLYLMAGFSKRRSSYLSVVKTRPLCAGKPRGVWGAPRPLQTRPCSSGRPLSTSCSLLVPPTSEAALVLLRLRASPRSDDSLSHRPLRPHILTLEALYAATGPLIPRPPGHWHVLLIPLTGRCGARTLETVGAAGTPSLPVTGYAAEA